MSAGIFRSISKSIREKRKSTESGEKNADWYDASFNRAEHWKTHYTDSRYYFLWTVITDRLVRSNRNKVLEVGCGPGQLASLLRDKGITSYIGFDFSEKRIQFARKSNPDLTFLVEDAFQTLLFDEKEYEAVVCTEFLEHVEGDLEVLSRIKPATYFIGTVPNFPYTSHVRHFDNEQQVYDRYAKCFDQLSVDSFQGNSKGKVFYLLEGNIKSR